MSDEHKKKLTDNRCSLVANLTIVPILSPLRQVYVLTKDDVTQIKSLNGDVQIETFLYILEKKSDESYWKFIEVLRSRDQEHVANILEPLENTTKTGYNEPPSNYSADSSYTFLSSSYIFREYIFRERDFLL